LTQPTGAPVSASRALKRRTRWLEHLQTNGAAIVVAALVALIAGAFAFDDPAHVPQLTIDNPTAYDIRVEVSDDARAGWTALTNARQHCSAIVDEAIDRGAMWTFRLHAQGLAVDEITVDRSVLERDGWHFTIPPSIAQDWDAAGVPHPPRQSC
jgi:hypothetical protein